MQKKDIKINFFDIFFQLLVGFQLLLRREVIKIILVDFHQNLRKLFKKRVSIVYSIPQQKSIYFFLENPNFYHNVLEMTERL